MNDPFAGPQSPRCEECPLTVLDAYMGTPVGQSINQIFDLEFALQAGVTITLSEISYREFVLLRYLNQERNRLMEESFRSRERSRSFDRRG